MHHRWHDSDIQNSYRVRLRQGTLRIKNKLLTILIAAVLAEPMVAQANYKRVTPGSESGNLSGRSHGGEFGYCTYAGLIAKLAAAGIW